MNGTHSPQFATPISPGNAVYRLDFRGKIRQLQLPGGTVTGSFQVTLDGQSFLVDAQLVQPGLLSLIVDGRCYRCVLDESPGELAIQLDGERLLYALDDPRSLLAGRSRRGSGEGGLLIKAPMPGRIVRLLVDLGALVQATQSVLVIEAMKMQNELKTARAGVVAEVRTEAGATVRAGETLMLIESAMSANPNL